MARKPELELTPSESEKPKAIKLNYKVFSYGDYLAQAREVYGSEDSWRKAIELLFTDAEKQGYVFHTSLMKSGEQHLLFRVK